jgi:hypothetical protein
MRWDLVNVVLNDASEIEARTGPKRSVVEELLRDGFEPFAIAPYHSSGIVMSFRREVVDGEPTFAPRPPG